MIIICLQIILVVFEIGLVVMALYDVIFTIRHAGDPTRITPDRSVTTINNPGFRENNQTGELRRMKIYNII